VAQCDLVETKASLHKLKTEFARVRHLVESSLPELRLESAHVALDMKSQLAEFQENTRQATMKW
jgi:hypothetical protein